MYRLRTSATFNNSGSGTKDYELLNNKPRINNVELDGNKSLQDLGAQPAGNYLTEIPSDYKTKTQNDELYQAKGSYLTTESDPVFSASAAALIRTNDITNWNSKVDANVNNLTNYTLATDTGSTIELSINSSTYVVTLNLKNSAGTTISTDTIDLPLESVVVSGSYDSTHKKIVLTLQSGSTIDIPVGDLVSGLQTEITANNKLSSDLIDDTNNINKFVTSSEKNTWNNKSDFSGNYNDLTNKPTIPTVPTNVSAFTNDAGYLTQHQDITGKLDTNKVKSATSTTAGDVYDVTYINTMLGNIETVLTTITTGGGVS